MSTMYRGIESGSSESGEALSGNYALLWLIGNRFIEAGFADDDDPRRKYFEFETDPETGREVGVIQMAESYSHHRHHQGEVIELRIPIEDRDVWSGVHLLDDRDDPNAFATIKHTKDGRSFTFRVTSKDLRPANQPKFGRHSRFGSRSHVKSYIEATIEKINNFIVVDLGPKGTANN
jgi:hypothetical protein